MQTYVCAASEILTLYPIFQAVENSAPLGPDMFWSGTQCYCDDHIKDNTPMLSAFISEKTQLYW